MSKNFRNPRKLIGREPKSLGDGRCGAGNLQAKGLSKAAALLSDIMMPTPSAVLQAMELLAQGCEGETGIGDLIASLATYTRERVPAFSPRST